MNGIINFVIPLLLYIAALRRYPKADRQRELSFQERARTEEIINKSIVVNNTESGEEGVNEGFVVTTRGECVPANEADNR